MSAERRRPASNTTTTQRKTSRGSSNFHPLHRASPGDDFFTDSIMSDGSRIPSPSPRKSEAVSSIAKPRRAIGNTKPLKAPWSSSGRNPTRASDLPTVRHLKSQPAPARQQRSAFSRAEVKSRNSTPSPSRGMTGLDLNSPQSTVSSPPKGLTEAYQRIADEEDLAGQEGDFSDEDFPTEASFDGASNDRLDRLRKSESPMSLRNSRRSSPRVNVDMGTPHEGKENKPQDHTRFSEVSDLSFLDQMTDQDLAAKLTPHAVDRAKDKVRLQRAVQRDSPIMFSRARMNPKARSGDNISHNGLEEPDLTTTSNGSASSSRSDRLDLSVNVPRTWGSKGRVGKDWMNKIQRKENPAEKASSFVDWTDAAADTPLPSTDTTEESMPAAVDHPSSLDRLRQWDVNDFTGTSLQVSNSPPVRAKSAALDEIREREIENLSKRAVTTNRLDELRKGSPELVKKSRSVSSSPELAKKSLSTSSSPELVKKSLSVSNFSSKPEEEELEPQSLTPVKDENTIEEILNTPIVIHKKADNVLPRSVSDTFPSRPQIEHSRDLREDLQRLSRATSASPKPDPADEDESIALKDFFWKKAADTPLPKREARDEDVSIRLNALDLAAKTPLVSGAWMDTIMPDTVRPARNVSGLSIVSKTPHVLGGWVDTPFPKREKSTAAESALEELVDGVVAPKAQPNETKPAVAIKEDIYTAPEQPKQPQEPKSALAAFLLRAKAKAPATGMVTGEANSTDEKTVDLGDLTVESLEDLLTLDNTDMTTLIRMSAELDARRALTASADNMKVNPEIEVIGRLAGRLEQLQNNIHSTRRGISQLEKSVSESNDQQLVKTSSTDWPTTACPSCGSHPGSQGNSTTISITLPFHIPYLRLFYPRPQEHKTLLERIPHPTPLGWLVILSWGYYVLESMLCVQYCHPLYADFYVWPEEPEPRFGAVIPTLLWRKTGLRWFWRIIGGGGIGGVVKLFWWFGLAVVRFFMNMLGLSDGFVDEGSGAFTSATSADHASHAKMGGAMDDGSMAYDEYL